jgi:hypothetical protein
MDYYSDSATSDPALGNLQNVDVSTLKFNITEDALNQVFQEQCPIDATVYCFYDGTSMTVDVFKNVATTVENWAATSNFTGTIYHMVNSYERWLDVARLPFTNIGDRLGNGGFGSITTIHSENDIESHRAGEFNPDGTSFWNETITPITSGEKAFNGSHTWHKLTKNGTGNVRAVQIHNYVEDTADLVNIAGIDYPFKSIINDGN